MVGPRVVGTIEDGVILRAGPLAFGRIVSILLFRWHLLIDIFHSRGVTESGPELLLVAVELLTDKHILENHDVSRQSTGLVREDVVDLTKIFDDRGVAAVC